MWYQTSRVTRQSILLSVRAQGYSCSLSASLADWKVVSFSLRIRKKTPLLILLTFQPNMHPRWWRSLIIINSDALCSLSVIVLFCLMGVCSFSTHWDAEHVSVTDRQSQRFSLLGQPCNKTSSNWQKSLITWEVSQGNMMDYLISFWKMGGDSPLRWHLGGDFLIWGHFLILGTLRIYFLLTMGSFCCTWV